MKTIQHIDLSMIFGGLTDSELAEKIKTLKTKDGTSLVDIINANPKFKEAVQDRENLAQMLELMEMM